MVTFSLFFGLLVSLRNYPTPKKGALIIIWVLGCQEDMRLCSVTAKLGQHMSASLENLCLKQSCVLAAQWYPFPFFLFGSRSPYQVTNPKKGTLIIRWLLGYKGVESEKWLNDQLHQHHKGPAMHLEFTCSACKMCWSLTLALATAALMA